MVYFFVCIYSCKSRLPLDFHIWLAQLLVALASKKLVHTSIYVLGISAVQRFVLCVWLIIYRLLAVEDLDRSGLQTTPHAQQPLMVKMKAAMIRYIPIIHLNLAIVLYFHFLMTSVAADIQQMPVRFFFREFGVLVIYIILYSIFLTFVAYYWPPP